MALALLYAMLYSSHCSINANDGVDLNLPLSGIAALLVLAFLKLKTPRGSFLSKIARIDWMYVKRTDVALISCVLIV